MKLFTIGILCLFLFGCELRLPDQGCGPGTNRTCGPVTTTINGQVYNSSTIDYQTGCWDTPYYEEPLWCDWYDDTTCCVWTVDGWYEEWCSYDGFGMCWEFTGAW